MLNKNPNIYKIVASVAHNAAVTPISNSLVLTSPQLQLQLQKAQLQHQQQFQQQQQFIHQQQHVFQQNNQISTSALATNTPNAVVVTAQDPVAMSLNSQSGIDKLTNSEYATVLIGNNANQNVIVNALSATLQSTHRRRPQQNDSNK